MPKHSLTHIVHGHFQTPNSHSVQAAEQAREANERLGIAAQTIHTLTTSLQQQERRVSELQAQLTALTQREQEREEAREEERQQHEQPHQPPQHHDNRQQQQQGTGLDPTALHAQIQALESQLATVTRPQALALPITTTREIHTRDAEIAELQTNQEDCKTSSVDRSNIWSRLHIVCGTSLPKYNGWRQKNVISYNAVNHKPVNTF